MAGAVTGGFIKIATGSFAASENYEVDFSTLPEKVDQLQLQGRREKDGAFQVSSTQCEQPIFVNVFSIKSTVLESLSDVHYPQSRWRNLYVYRGQIYDSFARTPAYLRLVALRLVEGLTTSTRDFSYEYYFAFRVPIECAIDPNSAITASNTILRSAVPVRY